MYFVLDHRAFIIRAFANLQEKAALPSTPSSFLALILNGLYYFSDDSFEIKQNIKLRSKFASLVCFQNLKDAHTRANIHTVLHEIICRDITKYCSEEIKYCTFSSNLAVSG